MTDDEDSEEESQRETSPLLVNIVKNAMYCFSKRRIISRGYFLRANRFQIKPLRLVSLVAVHFQLPLSLELMAVLKLKPLANSQQKCTAALKVIRFRSSVYARC